MWADHLFSFRIHAIVGFFVYRRNVSFLLLIKTWQWRLLCQLRGVLTEFLGIFTTNKKNCVQAEGAQLLQSVWKFSFYRLSLASFLFFGSENMKFISHRERWLSLVLSKQMLYSMSKITQFHSHRHDATIWNLKFSTSQALVTETRKEKREKRSKIQFTFEFSYFVCIKFFLCTRTIRRFVWSIRCSQRSE